MNGIPAPAEPVYRTCYAYDSATGRMGYKTYNYTEMLEKMKTSAPPEGATYWEPDEYGRVYIDPNHPMQAALEPAGPLDCSGIRLPAPGPAALPGRSRTAQAKKEEEELQEERLRMFREERERMAQEEAVIRRLMAVLSAKH